MAIEKVKEFFKKRDMADKILEFDRSSATVALAAQAIGCEEARIAKSLAFMVGDKVVLIVVAGDARIDNKKYKEQFSTKATMVSPDEIVDLVGYPIGGVCPFDVNEDVVVYLDESLKRFKTVYPACGSSNSAIELTISQLEKYSNFFSWIDVGRW